MNNLIAPTKKPQDFGAKLTDYHLVVNAAAKYCKAFKMTGELLWEIAALADGQHPNWKANRGDTPPGLYKIGETWLDYLNPPDVRTRMAYGWATFDLIDLEGNEDKNFRAGISIHGGGSALGISGAWEPYQNLVPTHGCIRCHNKDLLEIEKLVKAGTVFVSVYQDNI